MNPYQRTNHARREAIPEKNYFFIKSSELPGIDLSHSRYRSSQRYYGKLILSITALQELFIGCGDIGRQGNIMVDAFTTTRPEPGVQQTVIPGSSMKGSVFTNLSLFLAGGCMQFFSGDKDLPRVFFSDFPATGTVKTTARTIAARFGPRIDPPDAAVKLYLKEDQAYGGMTDHQLRELPALERIETISKGTRFNGFVNFKGLNGYQLAFLMFSLGCLEGHRFHFKIGGCKNRGMGLVNVTMDGSSYWAESLQTGVGDNRYSLDKLEPHPTALMGDIMKHNPVAVDLLKKLREKYGHE